ncbi:hypothetical protein EMCRGX_G031215 [Ephydatia muelleri]
MASSSRTIPTYQIALLGDSNVGKSSLFSRLQTGNFVDTNTLCTNGRDSFLYHQTVDRTNINVILFDTAGGERFRSLTRSYHRGKDAVILVYDVEASYTLDHLQYWIDEVQTCTDNPDITWAIFGNKCELDRKFDARILETYRLDLDTNLSTFVSAKTGDNVVEAFESVFAYVHRKAMALNSDSHAGSVVREDDDYNTVDLHKNTDTSEISRKRACC